MEAGAARTEIHGGQDVYHSDGERLGRVTSVGLDYILVTDDEILANETYVPASAVERVGEEAVWLNVPVGLV